MLSVSKEEINKLVGLHLGKRIVQDSDRLMEDLGAESADIAIIVAAAEEKYKILIKESEIARVSTPLDLHNLVQVKLNES